MKLNYTTEKLPLNFIALGAMLFALGIWRMIVLDWKGILFFLIALVFLFMKSGIIIDADKKRLKKYTGFFIFRKGEWEDIKSLLNLRIMKTKETQSQHVLSISRTDIITVYKLYMVLPDKRIELMSGKESVILKRAEKISSSLNTYIDSK